MQAAGGDVRARAREWMDRTLRLNDVQAPCPGVVIYGAKQSSEAFRREMETARAETRAAQAQREPAANATPR